MNEAEPTGGYWPSYLFSDGEVGQKVGSLYRSPWASEPAADKAARAHAANEYYAVEGTRWDNGMAGAEKLVVASIYEYSHYQQHAAPSLRRTSK